MDPSRRLFYYGDWELRFLFPEAQGSVEVKCKEFSQMVILQVLQALGRILNWVAELKFLVES